MKVVDTVTNKNWQELSIFSTMGHCHGHHSVQPFTLHWLVGIYWLRSFLSHIGKVLLRFTLNEVYQTPNIKGNNSPLPEKTCI